MSQQLSGVVVSYQKKLEEQVMKEGADDLKTGINCTRT